MPKELTIIIPCYNEAFRLKRFFDFIYTNRHLNWEWLFVDDGSTDRTAQMIEEFSKTDPDKIAIHSIPVNCGKGCAVRTGFFKAKGDLVGYVDADLSASPLQFEKYLKEQKVISGNRIIVGIRVKTQDGRVQRLLSRHLMGRCFQTYASVMTGLKAYDTQCGFKLLSRELAQRIAHHMTINGFAFDVEFLLLAHYMGIHIDEVMIHWNEMGCSKIRPSHIIQMVIDIIKIVKHGHDFRKTCI